MNWITWLRNYSIRSRLLICMGLVVAIGTIVGGGMSWQLLKLEDEFTKFAAQEFTATQRMAELAGHMSQLRGFEKNAMINAGDAKLGNWADAVIPHEQFCNVIQAIEQSKWQGELDTDKAVLTKLLKPFEAAPPSPLLNIHATAIDAVMHHDTLAEIDHALRQLQDSDEAWLAKAAQAYAHGSPTSAALSFELMKRHEGADLADVLRLEYQASVGCCAHNDFPEGVRALLVDKDKSPKWCPAKVDEVSADQIADILEPRFSELHPLHDLGKSN